MSTGSGGGLISGTPTGTSLVNFNITVADSGNSSQTLTIGVTPGSLTSITVTPTGQAVQTSGTLQMKAIGTFSNGGADLTSLATWSCTTTCGSVSSSGLFTAGGSGGTATIKAVFNSITDDGGAGVPVVVNGTVPVFITSSLCAGQDFQAFPEQATGCTAGSGQQLSCSGGVAPYTFALNTLALQSGFTLSSSGFLSGTPSVSGTNTGTINCTDAGSHTGTSSSLSLVVASVSSLTVALAPSTITYPQTSQATATATYSDATTATLPNNAILWTSGTTSCATVNGSGVISPVNVGAGCTSVITAKVGAVTNTATVTVNAAASNTASLVQSPRLDTCTSGTSTCNVTLTQATTASTGLICYANGMVGTGITLTSCTDGGDTFSSCTTLGGSSCSSTLSGTSTDMRAILSGAGGKTSLTCNLSASPTAAWTCGVLEFSTTSTGFTFDVSGSLNNSASSSPSGVALTLTGSNDIIVQNLLVLSGHPTAVTSPYTLNADGNGNAESYALNTASGTAPTFTLSISATTTLGAIALKQPSSGGTGQTRTAASCSLTDVQAKINLSATGDTVIIPGPCTMTTALGWSGFATIAANQGITIQCATANTCVIDTNANGFQIQAGTTAKGARITGINCNNSGNQTAQISSPADSNGHCVQVTQNPTSTTWRIDHWNWCDGGGVCVPAGNVGIFMSVNGVGAGLIDHNTLKAGNASAWMQFFGYNITCDYPTGAGCGWNDDVVPGGPNMVFIENNTFNNVACTTTACPTFGAGFIQGYGGTRTVIRFNTMIANGIDQHGSQNGGNEPVSDQCPSGGFACEGSVGVRWWEIYNNTWANPTGGMSLDSYILLRAGSGVVFNNSISGGPNTGAGKIQLQEENTCAWPQAFQIGGGIGSFSSNPNCPSLPSGPGGTTNLSPAYLWNNPAGFAIHPVGSVQVNRDYFTSTNQPATITRCQSAADKAAGCPVSYNYVPYQYPHPLDQ